MQNLKSHIQNETVCTLVHTTAEKLNIEAFLIGGYVRDLIMKRNSDDMDFVIGGDGIEFAKHIVSALTPSPKLTVFKTFQTAHFHYKGKEYEFVGARKESYQHNSRNPIVESATVEEDRLRRDFTINAMSIGLNNHNFGQLIDPFGGIEDIQKQIIRTPQEPGLTFDDDPLRMLRAIRFAAQFNFKLNDNVFEAIKSLKSRIHIVAPERITEEFNKILLTKTPSSGLKLLTNTGLLNEILPEMTALSGIERVGKYAHKDILLHTFEVVDNVAEFSDNLWLRWSALLHDIGKPATKRFQKEHGWTFHGHDAVGTRITEQIFKRLKLPLNDKKEYVKKMVSLHLRPIALVEDEVTDSAVRRLLFDAGDDIDDLMTLCRADITSKNEDKVKRYLENFNNVTIRLAEVEVKDRLRNWQPPISGELVMETFGLQPSKEVGIIKSAIKEAILDGLIQNNFEDAFKFMLDFAYTLHLTPLKKK